MSATDPQVTRGPAPYATPEELRAALVDGGVVHLTAVDGVYHRSWAWERVLRGVEGHVMRQRVVEGAPQRWFPPIMPREEFLRTDYLRSFPDLVGSIDVFTGADKEHRALLAELNGFVAFGGGLHLRGACVAPAWHSLRHAWRGDAALYRLFPALASDDVPFAEDALGDQYVLRDGRVVHLSAETGELAPREVGLEQFLAEAFEDPVNYLGLQPLQQFEAEGGRLQPGQLLSVYPPFCTEESANGVSLRAVPSADRIGFLSELAAHVSGLADGTKLRFEITE